MDVQVNNSRGRAPARAVVAPPVDILESDTEILIVADMPGASATSLKLTVEQGVLSIEAPTAPATGEVLLREGVDADYGRSFRLPRGIQADAISASLKDGVLSVRVPKRETSPSRRIPVAAG